MAGSTPVLLAGTGLDGTVTGDWKQLRGQEKDYFLVGVSFLAGSGTVAIEGRLNKRHNAVEIESYTADGLDRLMRVQEVRAVVTGASGLAILVESDEPLSSVDA